MYQQSMFRLIWKTKINEEGIMSDIRWQHDIQNGKIATQMERYIASFE